MSYNVNKERDSLLGKEGERRVAAYLRQKGYIIVKQNYRERYGEIDIIAEKNDLLVFVEVKTRSENALIRGFDAIDRYKQQRIQKTAALFLQRFDGDYNVRFDAAEVVVYHKDDGNLGWRLEYMENAF